MERILTRIKILYELRRQNHDRKNIFLGSLPVCVPEIFVFYEARMMVFNCSSSFTCFFFDSTGGEGYY